ncbi:MAG: acetolactate synthase small subunit [candidate division Zixibacteria bacterium]|nr:acetolactate synthase small subunit [candidate division Zixibacteria bacterium]
MQRHTISILVENKFGVLARIAGLFSGRGFNIDSITVGEASEPGTARMTIMTHGDEKIIEQIIKQLNRLIDIIRVVDLTETSYINRELALIKVNASRESRQEIVQISEIFQSKIVDISQKTMTMEVVGNEDKIDAIIGLLRPFGLREVARTGRVAMARDFISKDAPTPELPVPVWEKERRKITADLA